VLDDRDERVEHGRVVGRVGVHLDADVGAGRRQAEPVPGPGTMLRTSQASAS
jgi:hypothetical protein